MCRTKEHHPHTHTLASKQAGGLVGGLVKGKNFLRREYSSLVLVEGNLKKIRFKINITMKIENVKQKKISNFNFIVCAAFKIGN